jgi:peptidoglycan/LPS O-acetylase OafA/YrhL
MSGIIAGAPSPARLDRRDLGIDALRAIAVLMVIAHHYFPSRAPDFPGATLLARGFAADWTGVDLFFVISGLLVGGQMLDYVRRPRAVRTFYARRVARTLPLYAVLFALAALAGPGDCLYDAVHLAGWFGVTWSLAVEEQFYLVLPLLVGLVSRERLPIVLVAVLVVAPVLRQFGGFGAGASYFFPCRADALAFGVLVALALRTARVRDLVDRRRRPILAVTIALGVGLAVATLSGVRLPAVGYSVPDAFFAGVVLLVAHRPVDAPRVLVWIGRRSYALYLFHVPALALAAGFAGPGWASIGIALLGVMATAAALHSVVEQPIVDWARRRWRYDAPTPQTRPPPAPAIVSS